MGAFGVLHLGHGPSWRVFLEIQRPKSYPDDVCFMCLDKNRGRIAQIHRKSVRLLDCRTGKLITTFPMKHIARGIDVTPDGNYVVSFMSEGAVGIVSGENGKLLKQIKHPGRGPSPYPSNHTNLQGIRGLCICPISHRLFVVDNSHGHVLAYTSDGVFDGYIGRGGAKAGEMHFPQDVAVCPVTGNIVVAVGASRCVQVYAPDYSFLFQFGACANDWEHDIERGGNEAGCFLWPSGVTVDGLGRILVADQNIRHLQVFEPDGTFIQFVQFRETGTFHGVQITPEGRILVTDSRAGLVMIEPDV